MIRLAGSKALMPGYHAMRTSPNPTVPLGSPEGKDSTEQQTNCVANHWILTDILRGYLGFDGMVVSDYTAIDQLPVPDTLSSPLPPSAPTDASHLTTNTSGNL